MTGIVGFATRTDLDLPDPDSVSYNITPQHGGSTGHYGGGPQRVGGHADCLRIWRSWCLYHRRNGYVDIAYNGGFCDHGWALAGRGLGVRSGANGTNPGNHNFYAWAWVGGAGETPTRKAIDALGWWILQGRRSGGAGDRAVPHSWHKDTGCPGDPLRAHLSRFDRQPIAGDTPVRHVHFDQMVLGANAVDILSAAAMASYEGYGLGLGLLKRDQSIEVVWPPSKAGASATTDFAFVVGAANQYVDRSRFKYGTNRVGSLEGEPDDRWHTAADVARTLLEHPPDTIARTGKPW